SICNVPSLMSSRPTIIRRIVDFPQPEGPTRMTNSPSSISRSTPLTAVYPSEYVLAMPWRLIEDTSYSLAIDCAMGEAWGYAALGDEDDDDDRNSGDDSGSGDRPRGFIDVGCAGGVSQRGRD